MEYMRIPSNHVSYQAGCKVSWYVFSTEAEAIEAAKVAKHNAKIDEANGYDFGFQIPGEIRQVHNGWEVTFS